MLQTDADASEISNGLQGSHLLLSTAPSDGGQLLQGMRPPEATVVTEHDWHQIDPSSEKQPCPSWQGASNTPKQPRSLGSDEYTVWPLLAKGWSFVPRILIRSAPFNSSALPNGFSTWLRTEPTPFAMLDSRSESMILTFPAEPNAVTARPPPCRQAIFPLRCQGLARRMEKSKK